MSGIDDTMSMPTPIGLARPPVPEAAPRVRFGPRPTQEVPLDWASRMLSDWRNKQPKQFGEALARAAMQDDGQ